MKWADVPDCVHDEIVRRLPQAAQRMRDFPDDPDRWVFPSDAGLIHLKSAGSVQTARELLEAPQRLLGGPNALTQMLIGGGLGAALGYGGGKLLPAFFPRAFSKKKSPKRLAIVGALLGLGVPAWLKAYPRMSQYGWSGLLRHADESLPEAAKSAVPPGITKKAAAAGAAFIPRVPVDHFNQLILGDPATPLPVRAATAGLVNAASAAHGGAKLVSPFDIARIAVGMGSGAASGLLVGKTLGAIAGLTPGAQTRLQQAGALAGLLTNIVPLAFGN